MKKASLRPEREFGMIVGGVLFLVGLWWEYRDKFESIPAWLLAAGASLIVLGILFPRALIYPNRVWLSLGRILSVVTSPIILAVIYFGVITPIGVLKRLFGWDPLGRRSTHRNSYWVPYESYQRNTRHYEKMF